jgi:hypothetical protein
VIPAFKDLKAHKGKQVQPVQIVLSPVHKGHKGHKGHKVYKDQRAILVRRVQPVLLAVVQHTVPLGLMQ